MYRPLILVLAVLTAATPMPIDDFEDGDTTTLEGSPWVVYTDAQMEGKSTAEIAVTPRGADDSAHALRLSGELAVGFSNPFAGVAIYLAEGGAPEDLSAYEGLRFWARGDGSSYKVQVLTTAVEDHNEFSSSFVALDQWEKIEVPFDRLRQSPWWGEKVEWAGGTDVRGIGFQTDGGLGGFWLELDGVELY